MASLKGEGIVTLWVRSLEEEFSQTHTLPSTPSE